MDAADTAMDRQRRAPKYADNDTNTTGTKEVTTNCAKVTRLNVTFSSSCLTKPMLRI